MSADPNVSDPTTIAARGPARLRVPGPTLAQVFDTRINALNVWRLVLASGVILQHSWPLTGRKVHPPYDQLFTQVWVDGFFAISGFLIAASWVRIRGCANMSRRGRCAFCPGCGSAWW